MAKFNHGVNGNFSGKVGSVIGASWRGIPYMRGLSKKRTKPFSEAQLAQQKRFGLIGSFILPLKGLLEIGYAHADTSKAMLQNLVMRDNMPTVVGTYPDFEIDYAQIKLSDGSLLKGRGMSLATEPGQVNVSWNPKVNTFNGHADDDAYILLYNPELDLFYTTDEIVQRSAAQAVIEVDDDTVGHTVHVWLFFTSRDGAQISPTVYAGSIELE